MGLLDDAIRQHLELKRRRGADPGELARQEHEVFGPARRGEPAAPESATPEPLDDDSEEAPLPPEVAAAPPVEGPEPWLDEPDEVPVADTLEHRAAPRRPDPDVVAPDAEPGADDVLEETPEFLQETPDHDRLWFEQKPPREFDFDE